MASYKPEVTKTAVLVKTLAGESKSEIARDLGITRDTVRNILNESELATLVAEGKTGLYQLIPKAIRAFDHALNKHKTPEATLVLRSTGVLPEENGPSTGPAVTINLNAIPRPAHV